MSPLLDMQVRFRELGRIRAGEKGPKGEPRKRSTWRITSASQALLEQAAALPEIGGKVREWKDAPDEGYFELLTETDRLDVMIPPVVDSGSLLSQHYELWSGGGCVRRCDGLTEALSGKPCLCDPEERACTPTTRLSVMIPKLGGIGVWRLDTGGINAALELPGAFALIVRAAEGQFMPAVLRLEQRSDKKEGLTRRYVVPVLDMEQATMLDLVSGQVPGVLGPAVASGRPELPTAGEPPKGNGAAFEHPTEPPHGEPPPLPDASPTREASAKVGGHKEAPSDAQVEEEPSPNQTPSSSPEPSLRTLVAGDVTFPDGYNKGKSIAEVAAKGPAGEKWLRSALEHPEWKGITPEITSEIETFLGLVEA